MSTEPESSNLAIVAAGEPTLFDSLARLVPEELQAAYYRVLAHTRKLSPDDEMLRILEAMGILALLTRQTPKEIAEERERFQEMLDLHQEYYRRSATEDARLCLQAGVADRSTCPRRSKPGLMHRRLQDC
jgi:predicted secreted protein